MCTIRGVDNQSIIIFAFLHPTLTVSRISLNTLTLNVKSDKVYTRHGVPISVTGIAQVSAQLQMKQQDNALLNQGEGLLRGKKLVSDESLVGK